MDPTAAKLTDEDKLAKIREFKEKGNAAHKEGNYKKAAGSYHRAILYIKGLSTNCPDMADLAGMSGPGASPASTEKMPPQMLEESKKLTCDCYNNLAGMWKELLDKSQFGLDKKEKKNISIIGPWKLQDENCQIFKICSLSYFI